MAGKLPRQKSARLGTPRAAPPGSWRHLDNPDTPHHRGIKLTCTQRVFAIPGTRNLV